MSLLVYGAIMTGSEYLKAGKNGRNNVESRVLLKKKMSAAERRENWIYLPKRLWNYFPPGSAVKVLVNGKEVEMKVNKHGYMNPAQMLWETFAQLLGFDKDRDTLVFVQYKDGKLGIACEKGTSTAC